MDVSGVVLGLHREKKVRTSSKWVLFDLFHSLFICLLLLHIISQIGSLLAVILYFTSRVRHLRDTFTTLPLEHSHLT